MFQSLFNSLPDGGECSMTVLRLGSQLQVVFIPGSGKAGACLSPKCFTAPPEDLDTEIPQVLAQIINAQSNLADQIKAMNLEAEAEAAKASAKSKPISRTSKALPAAKAAPAGLLNASKPVDADDDPEEEAATSVTQGSSPVTSTLQDSLGNLNLF